MYYSLVVGEFSLVIPNEIKPTKTNMRDLRLAILSQDDKINKLEYWFKANNSDRTIRPSSLTETMSRQLVEIFIKNTILAELKLDEKSLPENIKIEIETSIQLRMNLDRLHRAKLDRFCDIKEVTKNIPSNNHPLHDAMRKKTHVSRFLMGNISSPDNHTSNHKRRKKSHRTSSSTAATTKQLFLCTSYKSLLSMRMDNLAKWTKDYNNLIKEYDDLLKQHNEHFSRLTESVQNYRVLCQRKPVISSEVNNTVSQELSIQISPIHG